MDKSTLIRRVLAVLIGLRALTNVFKPFGTGSGLVFFGKLLGGLPNTVLAPALGLYMLVFAYGLWQACRFALPMGVAYGAFVALNLSLFPLVEGLPEGVTIPMYAGYAIVALGVAWGAVFLLWRRPHLL